MTDDFSVTIISSDEMIGITTISDILKIIHHKLLPMINEADFCSKIFYVISLISLMKL